jgi:DHA1 family tetracycline resistance protein-like MFS transporter
MRCYDSCRSTLILLATPASMAWSASPAASYSPGHHRLGNLANLGRNPAVLAVGGLEPTYARSRRSTTSSTCATASASSSPGDDDAASPTIPIGVFAVLSAAFLNLLGFTMAGPITPALGQHFGLKVGAKFGSLTSAYPLGMLFGLFIWPQFSDRRGRKPVMALSLLGSAIGLSLQSHAIKSNWSLSVFLASRVLTGCFAGSSPVSKAYLADIGSKQGLLPRYLALRDAASTLAFILGPTLGGLFYEARRAASGTESATETAAAAVTAVDATSSLSFVIGTSAVASLAASLLIALFVQEESAVAASARNQGRSSNSSGKGTNAAQPASYEEEIISCPLGTRLWTGVASVCVVSFLFNVGDSTFFAFFPALLKNVLGLDPRSIGLAFTSFACISFAVSTTITGASIRKHGPVATCIAGLSAIGSGLLILSGASRMTSVIPAVIFGAAALYYCGVPLYGPTVPTMLLRCVPPHRRGAVMGLDGAVNTLARVISPLIMGNLYSKSGPSAAFGVAGAAAFSAAIIAFLRRVLVLRGGEARISAKKAIG